LLNYPTHTSLERLIGTGFISLPQEPIHLFEYIKKGSEAMRIDLDGLDLFFPYDYMYREQYEYMLKLKRAIDQKGHALLEMPTGTGKTVCLVSLITAYQFQYPATGKLIYCTRTVPEMVKCIEEIKKVINYRVKLLGPEGGKVLGVCLSSRRNMCVHPRVIAEGDREAVDSLCRNMTASWVRDRARRGDGHELCSFYENYDRDGTSSGTVLCNMIILLYLVIDMATNHTTPLDPLTLRACQ
jgi:DNA excision repair protein ERCC-2